MKNFSSVQQSLLKSIDDWSKDKQKLVIGIDGITGVGKTTLADFVEAKNPNITLVHIDDFMTPLEFRSQKVMKTKDQVNFFIHNWFEYQDLRDLVDKFRTGEVKHYSRLAYRNGKRNVPVEYDLSKPLLVIEGVLLFHPDLIDDIWDRRVFLTGDEEKITRWRIEREKARWGDKYIPEDHPTSWWRFILKGLKEYHQIYHPEQKADLAIYIENN